MKKLVRALNICSVSNINCSSTALVPETTVRRVAPLICEEKFLGADIPVNLDGEGGKTTPFYFLVF